MLLGQFLFDHALHQSAQSIRLSSCFEVMAQLVRLSFLTGGLVRGVLVVNNLQGGLAYEIRDLLKEIRHSILILAQLFVDLGFHGLHLFPDGRLTLLHALIAELDHPISQVLRLFLYGRAQVHSVPLHEVFLNLNAKFYRLLLPLLHHC